MTDSYEVIMPEDGWDNRKIPYYCEFCNKDFIHKSVYLNMDYLLKMNMTQSELALQLHLADDHEDLYWDKIDETWKRFNLN